MDHIPLINDRGLVDHIALVDGVFKV
jgi:hypothetical protein